MLIKYNYFIIQLFIYQHFVSLVLNTSKRFKTKTECKKQNNFKIVII
jgi:hypothetical protein